jgi:hypothetical protein
MEEVLSLLIINIAARRRPPFCMLPLLGSSYPYFELLDKLSHSLFSSPSILRKASRVILIILLVICSLLFLTSAFILLVSRLDGTTEQLLMPLVI